MKNLSLTVVAARDSQILELLQSPECSMPVILELGKLGGFSLSSAGNSGGSCPPWGPSRVWELIPAGKREFLPSGAQPSPGGTPLTPALCSGKGNSAAFIPEECSKHPKLLLPYFPTCLRDDFNTSKPIPAVLAPCSPIPGTPSSRFCCSELPFLLEKGNQALGVGSAFPFFGIFQAEGQWWLWGRG